MSFNAKENNVKTKHVIGTWEYAVPDAPYEYQKGELTILKENGELTGHILLNGHEVPLNELTFNKGKVTFYLVLEGTQISFDLAFSKKTFKGLVSYFEGDIEITGEKKKK